MMTKRSFVFFYSLTSAHPGTGQAVGVVDLPVQREVHTELPMIQASGIKGAWRHDAEMKRGSDDALLLAAFGPPTGRASDFAGSLSFTDARIVAFPVRSAVGLLAWVTSPFCWNRMVRDATTVSAVQVPPAPQIDVGNAVVAENCPCVLQDSTDSQLILEAYTFSAKKDVVVDQCSQWLADQVAAVPEQVKSDFYNRLIFVDDDSFRDLTKHGADIVARITLGSAGTTSSEGGNLWYEELIPPETIFYSLVFASDSRADNAGQGNGGNFSADQIFSVIKDTDKSVLQIGGEASIGRGFFYVSIPSN
jgi:CRISPR-associated protein Cmr4